MIFVGLVEIEATEFGFPSFVDICRGVEANTTSPQQIGNTSK